MKIVHIDTGKEMRGGQHQIMLLAEGLCQRGHEQLIVCPEGSALEERARQAGFRVFALPRMGGFVQLWQALAAESFDIDIVHAHDGRGQNVAYLATVWRHARSVATRRVTFLPRGLGSVLGIHGLKYHFTCDGVIAVSQFVRRLLVNSGVPEAKIEVIPDGIVLPAELPCPDLRTRARAQWGFGEQEFVVGHVGAFSPEKGQEAAIAAMILLAEKLANVRLVLAGPVPVPAPGHLQALLDRAGDRVRLAGYVENLSELFAGLDLYIMPSLAEGLGSSALLAMAHGLPVVASRVGGLPEVVEEGGTGWLVTPEPGGAVSPRALAEALACAASERQRLREFGRKARERARRFSSDIMVARTEAFYRRLLARG
jgi:glycosyltransferase involved in cell wall biosynthesis